MDGCDVNDALSRVRFQEGAQVMLYLNLLVVVRTDVVTLNHVIAANVAVLARLGDDRLFARRTTQAGHVDMRRIVVVL